jgi:hypothetical protein
MKEKCLSLIGTALTLALTSNVAIAQSSRILLAQENSPSTGEIKMSPEGMKILCENFPLNSRCQGGASATPSAPGGTTSPEAQPSNTDTTPTDTTAPEDTTIEPNTPGMSPNPGVTTPGRTRNQIPEVMPDTTIPDENLAPEPGVDMPDTTTPDDLNPAPGVDPNIPNEGLTPMPGADTPDTNAPDDGLTPGSEAPQMQQPFESAPGSDTSEPIPAVPGQNSDPGLPGAPAPVNPSFP